MPCNSDYLAPTRREQELSAVALLSEYLDGKEFDENGYANAYHPSVYGKHITKEQADAMVSGLCARFKKLKPKDVKGLVLDAQIWWRDHQIADANRKKAERAKARKQATVQRALSKLTPAERAALGF